MSEDWATVSRAINGRMTELGLSQRELIERSGVSKRVVSELMRNVTPQPRRGARTLEALSTALDWHPEHLAAVLANREPPSARERTHRPDDIPARLAAIERQMREIAARLDEMRSLSNEQFAEINKRLTESGIPDRDGRTHR